MRNFFLIIPLFFSFIFFQCRTAKNAGGADQLSTAIKGKWKIEHEVCCGRNSSTTYGGNKSIYFNTKKSIYTIYKGDQIEKQGQYTLQTGELGTMIKLDENYLAILRITDGKLYIDRSYMDLRREVYQRP